MGNQPPSPLDLVNLSALMELTRGCPQVSIGLIDGPIASSHPDLAADHVRYLTAGGACQRHEIPACRHGTFVAGVLAAHRNSSPPAICPECTVLVRAIFTEWTGPNGALPIASAGELTLAIRDCIRAGARILNLSVA